MPTYDGTYKLAVEDGRVLIRDVEGGSQSTHVPLEIYSNYAAQSLSDSRQLRLRTQPYLESNAANAYVTDMGIESGQTDNYFFITAPQKTANAGDRSTFVISKTSNVGIGTTDPEKPLHVVGDSWVTGTLTTSNIVGASPVTISSSIVMAAGTTLTAGAIEPPEGSESNLKIAGTITTSNIVANTGDNLLVSSNLEVGTSNLLVDTTTGRVGIGLASPDAPLHIYKSSNYPEVFVDYGAGGQKMSLATGTSGSVLGYSGYLVIGTITDAQLAGLSEKVRIDSSGNVGIGIASPTYKLHVDGVIKSSTPSWNLYKSAAAPTGNNTGTLSFDTIKASAVNCTINTSGGYYYRVTITVAGRYFVGFNAFTETNQTGYIQCYIRINGNNYVRTYTRIPTYPNSTLSWGAMGGMGAVIDLNVNDYVEILNNGTVYVHEFDNASFYGFMI